MGIVHLSLFFASYFLPLLIFLITAIVVAIIKGNNPISWILYVGGAITQISGLLGNHISFSAQGRSTAMTPYWTIYFILLLVSFLIIRYRKPRNTSGKSPAPAPTDVPKLSLSDDAVPSVEKKEAGSHLRLSRKVKILLFVLFYGAALFIQFMAFTPYTETQTTMSSKNIPHTRVIDSGYTSFYEANDWSTIDAVGISSHTQINTPLFAFQLILTTAIFVFIFFFLYRKHFFAPDNRVKKKRIHTLHYNIKDRLTDILGAGGSIVFFVISYIFLVMPLLVLHLHFLIDILLIFLIATIPLLGFFIELILWICSLVSLIHNPFDATILNIVYFLALAIYIWGKGIPGLISVFLGFFSRKKNQ